MVDYDPANQNSPDAPLVVLGGKPSIEQLKDAIRHSAVSNSYPESFLYYATKNDLIYVCRVHDIAVPGLPGASDIEIDAPVIDTDPANDSVTAPDPGVFSVVVSGGSPFNYQWEINTGDGWVEIEGANEDEYTTPATSSNDDGNQYRVRVWNSAGSVTSEAATLTVGE